MLCRLRSKPRRRLSAHFSHGWILLVYFSPGYFGDKYLYTLLSYRCGAAVSSRRTSAICDLWALQYLSDILALIFSFRDGCIFPPRTAKKGIKGMRAVTFIVRSGRQNLLAFPARAPREKTVHTSDTGG